MHAEAIDPSTIAVEAPAEVSATEAPAKASFWSRVKGAAVNVAKRIAKPVTYVAAKAAPAAKKVAQATKRAAVKVVQTAKRVATKVVALVKPVLAKIQPATDKTVAWTRATWKRVIKPFLKIRVLALGILAAAVGLLVAPVTTLIVIAAVGAALYALSFGIEALEASTSKAARVALRTIEIVMSVIKGLVYGATAALMLALSIIEPVFGLTELLELVLRYRGVKGGPQLASMVFFVLVGSWFWAAFCLGSFLVQRAALARGSLRRSVDEQPAATGQGNRRVRLPKCTACGVDDGGARFALRGRRGICEDCFQALAREDALEAARKGRLTQREYDLAVEDGMAPDGDIQRAIVEASTRRYHALMVDEVGALPQRAASEADLTKVHWAEVAWWHDDKGVPHVRKWFGFVAGSVVASVEYNHRAADNRYRASLVAKPGKDARKLGGFRTLTKAHEVVADALSDEAAIVNNMLDGLRDEAEEPAPATADDGAAS